MGYAEEEDELHVQDQVGRVGKLVEGSRCWTEYGVISGDRRVEAEKVAEDEAEDRRADPKHDHQLCPVDEDLADFKDFDLPPLDVQQEESESEEEETLADIPKHQTVNQWECENHEGRRVRLRV